MDAKTNIAIAALVVSILTAAITGWRALARARKADVSAYFNWLPAFAYIDLPSGDKVRVGYHLVLQNRGPHRARNVNVRVYAIGQGSDWQEALFTDIRPEELPLESLDSETRYPIPWALGEDGMEFRRERRFEVELAWKDSRLRRRQVRRIPLRKGNIGND